MNRKENAVEHAYAERRWAEIRNTYEDEGFCRIDAWKTDDDSEEGQVIAVVDMLSGRVFYNDVMARVDEYAQEIIQETVKEAKEQHPYGVERLEKLLRNVVDYECEEGLDNGRINLKSYGFTDEEMEHFGFPEMITRKA